ncbi:MAG TPA: 30S ribosomal protein S1 [Bryobacteraceae bacterium]|nr:30S ribosomal protein S1 [Bryobacteraceae bacterium]
MPNQSSAGVPPEAQAAASEDASFASILSQFEQEHHLNGHDQAIQGRVVSITPEAVFVDIGRKMDGVIPAAHFTDAAGQVTVHVGDTLIVNVTGRDEEGLYQLSTLKVERPRDWSAFEKAFSEGHRVAGTVIEAIKGGLRVEISGIRGFMPASRSGARDQAEMDKLIGQEIECRIIKLDTVHEDVVVDRRAVLEEDAVRAKEKIFSEMQEGRAVRGTVRSVTDFGAFVDIGGVDGLLHVADMSWTRVAKPSDILKPGDQVDVKILKINPETHKISLGMKQLVPDPWTEAASRFNPGDRVDGTVSRITDFGAFVELMPGVDGLIHISEMSWSKKLKRPGDVVKKGERVQVQILGVNAAEHRISLGLKQALGDPWDEAEKKYQPGAVVEGPVVSLASFGAFVDLGDGIEGMIHIGDISRDRRLNHPREALASGQTVRAQVLDVDKSKRRIRLGMKQLEPTSADNYIAEHKEGDAVTGRIVDVRNTRARVELGEGVHGDCVLAARKEEVAAETPAKAGSADLSSMTAMLAARWKQGAGGAATAPKAEAIRAGQIRSFRITHLDPANKRIELELAE